MYNVTVINASVNYLQGLHEKHTEDPKITRNYRMIHPQSSERSGLHYCILFKCYIHVLYCLIW